MNIVSLNVGIRLDNASEVAKYLKELDCDVICLQEVTRHFQDSVKEKFRSKQVIDDALSSTYGYSFFGPLWICEAIKHGNKMIENFEGLVEQGNYILSKYPFLEAKNMHYYKEYSLALDWTNWKKEDHGRAIQDVTIDFNGNSVRLGHLHGIWTQDKMGDERTVAQSQFIVDNFGGANLPVCIVGDFNLDPSCESVGIMNGSFRNMIKEYGIKATRPDFEDEIDKGLRVDDYIFVNDQVRVKGFEVLEAKVSDHYPLVLDFDI
ncbi:endonuclease/exonuclease/phosphatase family protein [Candidatus Dojkabacteria bacterium]|nr:endonuclease/exonuclease/phosphatase family protein [Candidatus Dojkabacteria bacterium]